MNRISHKYSANGEVYRTITRYLLIRRAHKAFHPDAPQQILTLHKNLFSIRRTSLCGKDDILALCNVSHVPVKVELAQWLPKQKQVTMDLISGQVWQERKDYTLKPYQCFWLVITDRK